MSEKTLLKTSPQHDENVEEEEEEEEEERWDTYAPQGDWEEQSPMPVASSSSSNQPPSGQNTPSFYSPKTSQSSGLFTIQKGSQNQDIQQELKSLHNEIGNILNNPLAKGILNSVSQNLPIENTAKLLQLISNDTRFFTKRKSQVEPTRAHKTIRQYIQLLEEIERIVALNNQKI